MNFNLPNLRACLRAWLRLPPAFGMLERRLERLTFDLGCVQDRLSISAAFPRECEYQVPLVEIGVS